MRLRRRTDEVSLLVSGFGERSGGGIFVVCGARVEQIDSLSSTGLAVADGRVARLVRSATEHYGSELLLYDARGVARYVRLDDVVDPHDVVWDGTRYVVASTTANSLFWLSEHGEVVRRWEAPGDGDAWHLNSLVLADGRLHAAAFGRFEHHRDWIDHKHDGRGIVFDVESGRDVLTGLDCPHHPRRLANSWLVCNSARRELLLLDEAGQVVRRLELRSWTRGLAVADGTLFVGESATRDRPDADAGSSIAVLSQKDWRVRDRIPLPCDEIYDVVVAPPELVDGVRRGFRTNPLRTAERDQLALFDQVGARPKRLWATGDALAPGDCRVSLTAAVPENLAAGSWHEVPCRIENLGPAFLVSAPPHPVHISYRWVAGSTAEEGERTRLPQSIAPRTGADCLVGIRAPAAPGTYELRVTLVQEGVAWFDDLDPANAWAATVMVV
jgi:acetolactate synthase I/II/III large subunit